ncbi:MAG: L,D-transpeptidase, partial [Paracoccaceae bacterium]
TVCAFALLAPATAEAATVVARVKISEQQMTVSYKGRTMHTWAVSTARRGKVTPVGTWKAKWLSRNHKSSIYDNAPMPYSIFYNGNYAVHGTTSVKKLGQPASAGCVRLHPDNAAILFAMAKKEGLDNVMIVVEP